MEKLYRTIGEVSVAVGVSTSKLRYWERCFEDIFKPARILNRRHYYGAKEVNIACKIRDLSASGYTVAAIKQLLHNTHVKSDLLKSTTEHTEWITALTHIRDRLHDALS